MLIYPMGPAPWLVVLCFWSVFLRVEVSVKLVRVFFGITTFFRALSCWRG